NVDDGVVTRTVQGSNARAKLIGGGSVALLLGNPLSSSGQDASSVSAGFFDPTLVDASCQDRRMDDCVVSVCSRLDLAMVPGMLSAGAITLDDGTGPIVLEPTNENRYPSGGQWQSGEKVAVS